MAGDPLGVLEQAFADSSRPPARRPASRKKAEAKAVRLFHGRRQTERASPAKKRPAISTKRNSEPYEVGSATALNVGAHRSAPTCGSAKGVDADGIDTTRKATKAIASSYAVILRRRAGQDRVVGDIRSGSAKVTMACSVMKEYRASPTVIEVRPSATE